MISRYSRMFVARPSEAPCPPDGGSLGRRRIVCRGGRAYVLEEPSTEWAVFDIGG
ncbi:hypothetical protein [Streptomyces sp. MS191]|uniref:hypothetical protein n=1 Tax=Streptomyces sp. ms191 TaxID=1827978 RepID=UPI00164FA61E|nr:hypothetical protein [Streptomyces sp. ms191]